MRIPLSAALAALLLISKRGYAGEPPCGAAADLRSLIRCALESSELVIRARTGLAEAQARRSVADRILPGNPTLELGAGRRRNGAGESDLDRSVEVAQPFEIGGQRGARVDQADAELAVARVAASAVEREVTTAVFSAAAQLFRARAAQDLVRDQREAADQLADVSKARTLKGVGAPLESELAEAARVQALREERTAALELSEAGANLAVAVGEDVGLEPVAGLPAAVVAGSSVKELEEAALRTRPEVLSARAEVEAARARAEVLRRERIPDVTIAAGWRHEEFSEILGVRLSVPLPFFRRNQGEIAGQEARIEQAAAAARQAELRIRLAVRGAYGSWQRAKAAAGAIAPDLESRLRGDVQALQLAYQRGTMQLPAVLAALRETQVARRALLDARVEAVQAALELARATGQSPCDAGGCR